MYHLLRLLLVEMLIKLLVLLIRYHLILSTLNARRIFKWHAVCLMELAFGLMGQLWIVNVVVIHISGTSLAVLLLCCTLDESLLECTALWLTWLSVLCAPISMLGWWRPWRLFSYRLWIIVLILLTNGIDPVGYGRAVRLHLVYLLGYSWIGFLSIKIRSYKYSILITACTRNFMFYRVSACFKLLSKRRIGSTKNR